MTQMIRLVVSGRNDRGSRRQLKKLMLKAVFNALGVKDNLPHEFRFDISN